MRERDVLPFPRRSTHLLDPQIRPLPSRPGLQAIYDEATTWYQCWYFTLRFEEELVRAGRHDNGVGLVSLRVMDERGEPRSPRGQDLNKRLAEAAATKLRRTDIPGVLGGDSYAVILPHTDKERAAVVAKRLSKALQGYRRTLGIAGFPEDATSPEELF